MELHELRALHAVIETGSIRRAANLLSFSPSAVGNHLKRLEADIGAPLVDRGGRMVAATAAGMALIAETRAAIATLEQAADLARHVAQRGIRQIRVGHNGASALDILQRVLPHILARDPALGAQLHEASSTNLLELLAAGNVELALCRPPVAIEGLADQWLLDEPLRIAVAQTNPIAKLDAVHLSDLASHPFVLPPRNHSARARSMVIEACRDLGGFRPARIHEATSTASILALVAAGAGVSILPRRSISYYRTAGVRSLRLLDPVPQLPLHLAWRSHDENATVCLVRTAILQSTGRRRK